MFLLFGPASFICWWHLWWLLLNQAIFLGWHWWVLLYWSKPTCGEECLFIGENSVQKLMIHKAICGFGSRKGPRETKRHRNASMDFKRQKSTTKNKYRTQQPHRDISTSFFLQTFSSQWHKLQREEFSWMASHSSWMSNGWECTWCPWTFVLQQRSSSTDEANTGALTNGPSAFCGTSPKKKLRWSLKPWMAQSFLVGGEGFQPNLQGLTLPGSHWIWVR